MSESTLEFGLTPNPNCGRTMQDACANLAKSIKSEVDKVWGLDGNRFAVKVRSACGHIKVLVTRKSSSGAK